MSLAGLLAPIVAHAHSPFDAGLGAWEWVIAGVCAAGALWVVWLSIRWTLDPGEEAPDHVKRSILDDDAAAGGAGNRPS